MKLPLRTLFAITTVLLAFMVIGGVQFIAGRELYGQGTQRALASIQGGQPVPGHVVDTNIFFVLILPNILAFCLFFVVFWLCNPTFRTPSRPNFLKYWRYPRARPF